MAEDLDRIVPLQPAGSRPPLYCVHAVSGSAYSYAGLARQLGNDQPVYGFESPGFDNDRAPVSSLPTLADEYTAVLREFQPDGPYQLLGWSLGGLLAFEMAKRLAAAGAEVSTLIMVDAGLPVVMDLPPERDILLRYLRDMQGRTDRASPEVEALFEEVPLDGRPEEVFALVEKAGVLPEEFDADLLGHQYAVFRAHLEGFYTIDVTGTSAGPTVHLRAAESVAEDMRWDRLIPGLEEHVLPGTHHSIWAGPSLSTMSTIISRSLIH
jgi:thioesterase domain-containing protein